MSGESAQVRALKERYRNSFAEKRDSIRALHQSLDAQGDLSAAKELLHKLAGSSGMYGYNDIASHCRAAMAHIEAHDHLQLKRSLETLIDLLE